MYILGISCYYHDSAACIVKDGVVIAAAQEERFTRRKHDPNFPVHAINYCLKETNISSAQLDYVVFYDNPSLTFNRILHSYLAVAPKGVKSWLKAMPIWLGKKLFISRRIRKHLDYNGKIYFSKHHEAHAASAFYPSPFTESAILTIDGVGEWATATYGFGVRNKISLKKELRFPDSLGLLYSAFTYFTGFKVNSGEYKLMGLAPYGEPIYVDLIYDRLIDVKKDGSLRLNMRYFGFLSSLKMTNDNFSKLFEGPPRVPEDDITKREMDIAASIQKVTEDIVLKMANHVYEETKAKYLCLAGGVALNCVANGRLLSEGPFSDIWIQPAAGDSGGCVGAALLLWHNHFGKERVVLEKMTNKQVVYLGPAYSDKEVNTFLEKQNCTFHKLDKNTRARTIAQNITKGKIVGYFCGRMEFGPRALGARSILGDPRSCETQSTMNLKIKYRESFRPFAPSVIREKVSEFFELETQSPFMLLVARVKKNRCFQQLPKNSQNMLERLKFMRSEIPAVTHVDYSARVQTVDRNDKPDYYDIIKEFENLTGCPVIVNTSFNVRGEPIVCTPKEAYKCFMRTEMDVLILENSLLFKEEQPEWKESKEWRNDLILD